NADRSRHSDFTESSGTKPEIIYLPPPDYRIKSVDSPTHSHVDYIDSNHDVDRFPGGNGPVMSWAFVGDTDGDEAGTRTGAQEIRFNLVKLTLEQSAHCNPAGVVRRLLELNAINPATRSRFEDMMR